MVFQNYALYPHMNVFNNMAYGLKNRKLDRDEIRNKVEQAAKTLELEGLLKRKPSELSGGQRQRVAMGRAIVRSPKVFLFDEPLSNLDAKLRVNMRIEIRRLQRELGITSIYVTHDQVEAMTLADRLVAMNAGVAEQVGSPTELYEQPATRFVGGFIGSPAMNFLEGNGSNGQLHVGGTPLLDNASAPTTLPDGPVTIGMRPEHLSIATVAPGDPGSAGGLTGVVDLVEPLGAETLVHTRLHATENQASLVTTRVSGGVDVQAGDSVRLSPNPDKLRFFDTNGSRIQ
jgi:sn-glycerol 3-phosphate transport system ATP-binding protein